MVFASLWPLKWSQDSFHTHSDVSLPRWLPSGRRDFGQPQICSCSFACWEGIIVFWTHIISAFLYVLWQLRSRTNCKEDIIYFNHSFGVFQVFPTSKKAHYSPALAPFCSLLTPEVNVWLFSSWMLLNVTSLSHTFCACLRWASNSRVQQWKQAPWEQWT